MVFAMLPEDAKKLIQFKNKRTIKKLIAEENLPDYMDGTCRRSYRTAPPNCISFRDMFKSSYNDKELDRMAAYFETLKLNRIDTPQQQEFGRVKKNNENEYATSQCIEVNN